MTSAPRRRSRTVATSLSLAGIASIAGLTVTLVDPSAGVARQHRATPTTPLPAAVPTRSSSGLPGSARAGSGDTGTDQTDVPPAVTRGS